MTTQRTLTEEQLLKLANQIEEDYSSAITDHRKRMERWRRYYQRWRNRVDPPSKDDEDKSNFTVPLIQWSVLTKLAREVQSLLGDDAEVVAEPVGPSDQRLVHKVARWMTWRFFKSMRALNNTVVFLFRKILFGRSFAYMPWHVDTYDVNGETKVWFKGSAFWPIWPDDLITPSEDTDTIHDFSWVIRRFRATPYDLLQGEREGRYTGISADIDRIRSWAESKQQRDQDQEIKREKDLAEGVIYEGALSGRGKLEVWEWYGYLYDEGFNRTEVVVRYLPGLKKIVSVQDLAVLYPKMRHRRPFVEASLIKDGSYWGMGFGELLEYIEDDMTANHRLFDDAGEYTVGPVMFHKPGSGLDGSQPIRYRPGFSYPTEDPSGVNQMKIAFDPTYTTLREQSCMAIVERITGQSDQNMGRAIDRPNAPRTARGQIALLEEGNIRASLDVEVLREDFGVILSRVWQLDAEFCDDSEFFRVTEEEAGGLFETSQGGARMTSQERGGRYDFSVKFATSVYSKEAEKERQLALYQLDLANPLIATNPRALWMITNKVHSAMGDANFSDLVPEPPDLGMPKNPREEWTLILQGEEVNVNPGDNDKLHMLDHLRRLKEEQKASEPDQQAIEGLIGHIRDHQQQERQKALMQSMVQSLAQSLAGNNEQTGGLTMQRPGVPLSLFGLQDTLQQLYQPQQGAPGGPGAGGGVAPTAGPAPAGGMQQ